MAGREARASGQQRLLGEPDCLLRADRARAGRASDQARRRGHHGGVRLPHDGDADPSVRRCAGVCGRQRAAVQHRRDEARGGALRKDQGGHDRAHAGQSVRSGGGEGVLRQVQSLAGRGQLRRAGHAVYDQRRDALYRHVGRRRHEQLLSAAPHDDGRGRLRVHQQRAFEPPDTVLSRLGTRLHLPLRPRQLLRPSLRRPVRRAAGGL